MRIGSAWRIIFALVLVLGLALTTVAAVGAQTVQPPLPTLQELKPGDILFMRNASDPWSKQTEWTHNGIYIGSYKAKGKTIAHALVEATSKGVVVTNLADAGHWYYKTTYWRGVKRLDPTNPQRLDPFNWDTITKTAADYAKSKIGTPYDYLFNKTSDRALYCSELVWWAYKKSGIDLETDKKTSIIYPDEEYASLYLTQLGGEIRW